MKVEFQPVSQNPNTITIDLSSSSSNRSCLTRRNIVIGAVGIGLTVATAAAAYFLTANAFTETAFPTNTTELSVNQSSLSLYNITRLVEEPPDYFDNCSPAFQAHLNFFKTCGVSVCDCMRNAQEVFKFFCNTYALGITNTPEECKENFNIIGRCREYSSC